MAQSTAGTNLAATAAAAGRKPACQVVVDWTRAGWGSEGAWVDETAYVRSLQLDQRAADLRGKGVAILGNSAAATGQVALDNSTGRFSPHNTGGALYPYIRDGLMVGVPVRIYLGFHHGATPERLVQFSGYIAEPSLQARGGVVTLRLRDRAWDLEQGRHSSVLYMPGTPEGYSGYPDAYFGELLELIPAARRPSSDLDRGLYPLTFAWLDDETAWDEMSSVAATQGGMVWFSKAGVLTFRDGAAWAANTVSQHTFTTGTDLAEAWRETDIWNHVVVRWGGGRVARLTELWAQNETLLLRPGEVRAVRARFSQPAYAVSSPVADVDYKATFYDGSEGTASLGVSATAYAQRATVTLTNGGARPLYVTRLRLRGWPVDFQDEEEAEAEDASSIGRYGRRTLPVRMLYVQSKGQAEAVADFLLARYRSPRATYRLTARAIPWLEVGDRVTVNIAATGHNEDFFIVGLGTAFDVGGGYRHTYELLRCSDLLPYSDWFVVGATAYGAAGRWFY